MEEIVSSFNTEKNIHKPKSRLPTETSPDEDSQETPGSWFLVFSCKHALMSALLICLWWSKPTHNGIMAVLSGLFASLMVPSLHFENFSDAANKLWILQTVLLSLFKLLLMMDQRKQHSWETRESYRDPRLADIKHKSRLFQPHMPFNSFLKGLAWSVFRELRRVVDLKLLSSSTEVSRTSSEFLPLNEAKSWEMSIISGSSLLAVKPGCRAADWQRLKSWSFKMSPRSYQRDSLSQEIVLHKAACHF